MINSARCKHLVNSQQSTQLDDPQYGDVPTCVLIAVLNKAIAGDDGGKGNMCCLAVYSIFINSCKTVIK
jgi:hypothetical protein